MKRQFLLLFSALICSSGFAQTSTGTAYDRAQFEKLMEQMNTSAKTLKGASFRFVKNERYEGEIIKSEQLVKQHMLPKKIYLSMTAGPSEGIELLFIPSENEGKARVNASSFLPTISLSPLGSKMRDDNRHTLYELGLVYTAKSIYSNYQNNKSNSEGLSAAELAKWVKYEGVIKHGGHDCHKITMNNNNYKIVNHTVLEGESILKIAKKLKLDEYKLLELNPKVKGYASSDIEAGQVIKVPTSYCKTILVYLDVKTGLPFYQKLTDPTGLVGEYSYYDLVLNPKFAADEFTEDFDAYGF